MNIIFGVILSLTMTIFGFKYANKYYNQKYFFDDLTLFLEYLQNNLNFQADTMSKIFLEYPCNSTDLAKIIHLHCTQRKVHQPTQIQSLDIQYINDFDKNQLTHFFSTFGTVDKDTQLQYLQSTIAWAKQRQNSAYAECSQKGKMYRTLSIMAGLVILIIFI